MTPRLAPSRAWRGARRPSWPARRVLAVVADALALVRLGRAHLADARRHLADGLLVDSAHHDLRGLRHLEVDPIRRLDLHRVRVAHSELDVAATQCGAVADTLDLEALLVPLRHAV